MSEEYKITAGTISGATLKSIDIEPSIIVDGKSYTASEFNKAVEMLKQPQLNENQQMVLDELKVNTDYHKFNKFQAVYWMLTNFINYPDTLMAKAYKKLTQNELEQVFQVFSQWALEQEEE